MRSPQLWQKTEKSSARASCWCLPLLLEPQSWTTVCANSCKTFDPRALFTIKQVLSRCVKNVVKKHKQFGPGTTHGAAAADRGQDQQDKGLQGLVRPHALLQWARQIRPSPHGRPGFRKSLQRQETVRYSVRRPSEDFKAAPKWIISTQSSIRVAFQRT